MTAQQRKPSRKYALTKLAAGDYVFPSNDGTTLWRVATYEDGIAQGLDHDLGTVWGAWKYRHNIRDEFLSGDPSDWGEWDMWESSLPTRKAAIDAALKALDTEV